MIIDWQVKKALGKIREKLLSGFVFSRGKPGFAEK